TGEGTSNLVKTVKACLDAQGLSSSNSDKLSNPNTLSYSPAAHRVLLALRCAKSLRPFHAVTDEDYLREVEILRPGTAVPSEMTVSRDINHLYLEMSRYVKDYFAV
ncbi:hypothetical protein BDN70DRAFT_781292, partial [Pholiota conissans]